jgi:hypothetical protein
MMWTLPGLLSASRTQTSNQNLLDTERRRDNAPKESLSPTRGDRCGVESRMLWRSRDPVMCGLLWTNAQGCSRTEVLSEAEAATASGFSASNPVAGVAKQFGRLVDLGSGD